MLNLIVNNRLRLPRKDIPKDVLAKIKSLFKYNNPEYFKKHNLGLYTGNVQRIIGTYHLDDTEITLPRGGFNKLTNIFDEFSIEVNILDKRLVGEQVRFQFSESPKLRDYQKRAVERILEAETCLICGAPASGKTEILLAAIAKANLKAGVLVHDKNLFEQWIERIEKRLQIPKSEIGRVGLGKFKLGDKITVMMQQTARNKKEKLKNYFSFLAADEVHHYAAKTFLETVDSFSAKYRVGVSATIKRQDLKHFLIHDLFGEIVFEIGRQDLVDLGYTTDIELHVIDTDFEFDYKNEFALTDYLSDKFKNYSDLKAAERLELAEQIGLSQKNYPQYLNAIAEDPDRNNLIYNWVKMEYNSGSSCIIFTKRRSHCQLWKDSLKKIGLDCAIFWSAKNKQEKERIKKDLKRLKNKEIRIAIGTVLDEGIDMPVVDAGFITYRNASNPGQLEQQAGRLARLFLGKSLGRLYYFHDENIDSFSRDKASLKRQFNNIVFHGRRKVRVTS